MLADGGAFIEAGAIGYIEAAAGQTFGGSTDQSSSTAGGGAVITNNLLGQTRAYAVDANLTSDSGDVVVDGRNTATLNVRNKMQVIGDTAVSVVLAYNQVGYESSD